MSHLPYLAAGLAAFGAVIAIGLFHSSLSRLLLGVLARPCQAAVAVRDTFWTAARRWHEWYLAVRQSEGMAEHNVFLQRILGAIACLVLLGVFLFNELHFGLLSLAPYLDTDAEALERIVETALPGVGAGLARSATALVAALGLVSAGLLWGAKLLDLLGVTSLGPWGRIRYRRIWMAVTIAHIVLTLALAFALAEARVFALDSTPVTLEQAAGADTVVSMMGTSDAPLGESAGFTDAQRPLARGLLLGHAGLMLTSSMTAGWGVVGAFILLQLLLARLLQGVLYLLGIPFAALDLLLNWLGQAILSAFEFIARCCVTIARPIGRWLGAGATDVDVPVGRELQANGAEPAVGRQAASALESQPAELPPPPAPDSGANNDVPIAAAPAAAENSRNWSPYSRRRV